LRAFVEGDVEVLGEQIGQAELGLPKETAGEHGVENGLRHKVMMFAEKPEIVIRSVHDQLVIAQGLKERGKVNIRQRINQLIPVRCGNLDETNLLRIGVKAVRLRYRGRPTESRGDASLIRTTSIRYQSLTPQI